MFFRSVSVIFLSGIMKGLLVLESAIFFARSKDLKEWEIYSKKGKWDKTMNPQKWEPVLYAGTNWTRLGFIDPDDDTPACHVGQALVTEINGTNWLYLFYATQKGNKDGKYYYQYDKIRAMRKKIK